jgi:hypothetical protein
MKDVCMYHLQHVPLTMDKVRKRHEWFTSRNEFHEFQTAYSNICQLHPHNSDRLNSSYHTTTSTTSSGGGSSSGGSSSSGTSSSGTSSSTTTNSSVPIMDGYSGRYFGKSSFPVLTQPRIVRPNHPNAKRFVLYQRNSNRRIMDVHSVRTLLENFLLSSPGDQFHKKRVLLTQPNITSTTISSIVHNNNYSPAVVEDGRQSNGSSYSKFSSGSSSSSNSNSSISSGISKSGSGSGVNPGVQDDRKWKVEIVYHDERNRSPCELVVLSFSPTTLCMYVCM